MNFSDYNLKPSLLKAIEKAGYKEPTEIQHQTLALLNEHPADLVAQAQTGTGKTAAFGLPLISRINQQSSNVEALILAPTRELANQVYTEIDKFTKYEDIRSYPILGGASYTNQLSFLKNKKPQIIVGTPGRVRDLIKRGALNLKFVKYFILDEADEMLNMGFLEEIQEILTYLPEKKTTWMFSATMPKPILELTKKHFNDPKVIRLKKEAMSNANIEQSYYIIRPKQKLDGLWRLISEAKDMHGIVFCRTRMDSQSVGEALQKKGMTISILNGDMNQTQRERSMRLFKKKASQLMVCTDVAARGIDVNNLTHVFNYQLPPDVESYVHRIGRTGRAGAKGQAISLIAPQDIHSISRIEKATKSKIEKREFASLKDIKKNFIKDEISLLLAQEPSHLLESNNFKDLKEALNETEKDKLIELIFQNVLEPKIKKLNAAVEIENMTASAAGESSERHRRGWSNSKGARGRFKSKRRGSGDGDGDARSSRGGDRRSAGGGGRKKSKSNSSGSDNTGRPRRKPKSSGSDGWKRK